MTGPAPRAQPAISGSDARNHVGRDGVVIDCRLGDAVCLTWPEQQASRHERQRDGAQRVVPDRSDLFLCSAVAAHRPGRSRGSARRAAQRSSRTGHLVAGGWHVKAEPTGRRAAGPVADSDRGVHGDQPALVEQGLDLPEPARHRRLAEQRTGGLFGELAYRSAFLGRVLDLAHRAAAVPKEALTQCG